MFSNIYTLLSNIYIYLYVLDIYVYIYIYIYILLNKLVNNIMYNIVAIYYSMFAKTIFETYF